MSKYKNAVMRLVRMGCTNRPFYRIVVATRHKSQHDEVQEHIGSFDPMPNHRNEKLVSLDMQRVKHHLGVATEISEPVARLLGLAGILPVHPTTYLVAKRNRRAAAEKEAEKEEQDSQAEEEEEELEDSQSEEEKTEPQEEQVAGR